MTTVDDIQKQIDELLRKKNELVAKEKEAVIQEVLSKIRTYGLTAEELGFKVSKDNKGKTTRTVAAKYRGPKGEEWSGRGRKPQWCTALEQNGDSLDNYLIKSE